ncbi:transcriptional regulator YeiL [Clostridium sporogenes]|uniref:transcriptional regulator YeiL n=1 Tax=Clostridium sporogenes TaxID=1509 RepID=UPI001C0F6042|nr:transcriptional regulator YeiL [Clostridium sporogenes]MBU5301133.1 transcriptional regulator YeiL [Clostridium sporogenes]
MKHIDDKKILSLNLEKHSIQQYFSFDITPYSSLIYFNAGEYILKEGSFSSDLYYITDGKAKLYLTHKNGKISLINFLSAPCFIGEMELIGAQTHANGVQALTPCTCLSISIEDCKDRLLNDNKFLKHLCLFLSKKAIGNTMNYTQNQSYPLDNRLAAFILMTANNNLYIEKHTEASEFLGISYRHLLYVLAKFCQKGILQKERYGYRIIDLKSLKSLTYEIK